MLRSSMATTCCRAENAFSHWPAAQYQLTQVGEMPRDERMLRAERTCGQADGPLKHLLRLRILGAIAVKNRQALHQRDEVWMMAAEVFLLDRECAPVTTFRRRVIACFLGDDAEIAECVGHAQALCSIQLL